MTSFDFDVIGDVMQSAGPKPQSKSAEQKPPAEQKPVGEQKPAEKTADVPATREKAA
jgi:hypothetical protein